MPGSDRPLKIMIVDDMRTVRMLLPAYFVGKNYVFFEAESGAEALENMIAFQPDLIITDVNMPEMDGFQLCKAARRLPSFASLPVILITGDAQAKAMTSRLNPECLGGIISKPLDPEEIRELVEKILGA